MQEGLPHSSCFHSLHFLFLRNRTTGFSIFTSSWLPQLLQPALTVHSNFIANLPVRHCNSLTAPNTSFHPWYLIYNYKIYPLLLSFWLHIVTWTFYCRHNHLFSLQYVNACGFCCSFADHNCRSFNFQVIGNHLLFFGLPSYRQELLSSSAVVLQGIVNIVMQESSAVKLYILSVVISPPS